MNFNQRDIPVVPGTTYKVSFRYRALGLTGVKTLSLTMNQDLQAPSPSANLSSSTIEIGVWKTLSMDWTAPTTGTAVAPDTSVAQFLVGLNESSGAKDI